MINPNDVNLIIFDMDGTIVMSQPLVYEGVKRAFAKLGWPVNFNIEDINRFIGVSTASTAGTLYEFITPPDGGLSPDEVRELVRAEYPDIFRTMALAFPGVKETLAELRKRGYKLAQYTNAATLYLNIVMSSLDVRSYYDYVECVQDNGLTKNQLAKKIKEYYGVETAIVGDRIHDIEAARENGCLSIGALYGYGEKEPEEADLTIKKFSDLLDIFDRRLPIYEQIMKAVNEKKLKDKPFIIGINGIDCSGKTAFANGLETFFKNKGLCTQAIYMDDFHNPKEIRYAGNNPAENYFYKSFNTRLLVDKLLKPILENGKVSAKLTLLDVETDKASVKKQYTITPDTVIIVEGVFLFRKELAPYLDYKLYLDISFEESKRRAVARDPAAIIQKYDEKYLPAQQKYIQEYSPASMADMVIDNTDWRYPTIPPRIKNRL
jgi:phosphoglycolate phosphatase-like HAD superfamily hydrolase/uridine kinase